MRILLLKRTPPHLKTTSSSAKLLQCYYTPLYETPSIGLYVIDLESKLELAEDSADELAVLRAFVMFCKAPSHTHYVEKPGKSTTK